ncbi:MAG: hypothetical protein R6X20_10535 [Phycisphaerae bacterium]
MRRRECGKRSGAPGDAGDESSLPEAEDLTRDRPALEPPAPGDDLPVAEFADPEDDLPLAEEIAPPKPPRKAKAPQPAREAEASRQDREAKTPRQDRDTKAPKPSATEDAGDEAPAPAAPPAEPAGPAEAPDRPRRRWGRWLVAAVAALLLLAVVFLPQILSLGPVRRYALGEANRRLPVRVAAARWSLSWFGGQTVEGVDVRSAEDVRLARVRRVMLRTGLLDLLLDPRRLGPVEVDDAEVWVDELRAALAEAAPAEAPEAPPEVPPEPPEPGEVPPEPAPPEPPPPAEPVPSEPGPAPVVPESVEVDGLVVHVGGHRLRVPEAGLRPEGDRHAFTVRMEMADGTPPARGTVEGLLTGLVTDWQGADRVGVEAVVTCQDLPLATAAAAAGAADADLRVAGTVSGKATLARTREALVIAKVDLTAKGLEVTGEALAPDRPYVGTVDLDAEATYDRGAVTIGTLELTSPVATARASGTFGLGSALAPPSGKGSAEVRVNLARLARMLRHTLGLREGLEIESGALKASLKAVSAEASSRMRVIASLQDFAGRHHGDLLTLSRLYLDTLLVREHAVADEADKGAAAEEAARTGRGSGGSSPSAMADNMPDGEDRLLPQPARKATPQPARTTAPLPGDWLALADTLRLESFVFSGAFGAVEASGRLSHVVLDADLDLARAVEEVGRFVDLGEYEGAGTATVHVETGRNLEGHLTASTQATFRDLRVDLPGKARLSEPRATLSAETVLRFDPPQRLAAAELADLTLEAETASVAARGALRRSGEAWQVETSGTGEGSVANAAGVAAVFLERMQRRARKAEVEAAERAAGPAGPAAPRSRRGSGGSSPSAMADDTPDEDDRLLPQPARTTPPAPAEDAAEPADLTGLLLALCRRAAGAAGPAADGTWTLAFEAGGTMGRAMAVKADAAVADVRLPPETEGGEPFQLDTGTLQADVEHVPGEPSAVTVNALALELTAAAPPLAAAPAEGAAPAEAPAPADPPAPTEGAAPAVPAGPAATLQVAGPTTVVLRGPATRIDGAATATATANLPALAAMLRPLALVPADLTAAGDVKVTLAVTPVTDAPTKVEAGVRGEQIDLAWGDGRRYTDPLLRASAVGTLDRGEGGQVRSLDLAEWSVATVAGALEGTARGRPTAEGWVWDATAGGDGTIQPVAHTSARLLAAEPQTLTGMWHLKASYAGGDRRVEADLSLTDLAMPGTGEPPAPEIRLEDVRLEVTAAMGADGQVQIPVARVAGPGLTAEASGTARLPSRRAPHPRADGEVRASIALAEFAQVLRPFGLLAEKDRLAGHADFAGEVRSDPTGLGGSGTLALSELEVHLAEGNRTFREAEARLPIAFAYVNETKRWEVAATDMSAVTVHGSWRVAVEPGEADEAAVADEASPAVEAGAARAGDEAAAQAQEAGEETPPAPPSHLEATCDLAFDGGRVRQMLGTALPETIQMAGPYHAKARLSGPLPAEGPWHTRLAALEGEGDLEVNRFTYATLTGGEGTIRWRLAGGVLDLSADPDRPSRLKVADGTLTLPGRLDLRGPRPRLVVDEQTRVVEGLPLAGPEVREYIKYASPVLAASVEANGRLTLDVVRLDLPLGEKADKTARGDLRYHIDAFQTELMGPIGRLIGAVGGQKDTVVQTLGPVEVTLRDGVFRIPEHRLRYTDTVSLSFGGRIGLDRKMKVTVGVPVTRALMEQYKVSERAMPYLEDVVLAVPLEGTIDDPKIDNRALAKRMGELALEAIKREALKHLGDWLKGGER